MPAAGQHIPGDPLQALALPTNALLPLRPRAHKSTVADERPTGGTMPSQHGDEDVSSPPAQWVQLSATGSDGTRPRSAPVTGQRPRPA